LQIANCKFAIRVSSATWAVNFKRQGFTLLEMILSLAILAGAMAAIGELVRMGSVRSSQAVELTRAELLAESVMEEIVAGARPSDPVSMAPYEQEFDANGEPMWLYSIETESTAEQGMFAIRVTVGRNDPSGGGAEYSLVRWMIDPEYLATLTSSATTTTGGQP
jgi:type II secretion system protein I